MTLAAAPAQARSDALRVLMVSPRFPPYVGGVESHVHDLARFLHARGHAVSCISTDPEGRLPAEERVEGVRVRRLPALAPMEVGFWARGFRAALREETRGADLVHAHNYRAFPMWQTARALPRDVPLVVTLHVGFSKIGPWIYRAYNLAAGREILRRADRIILVSKAELDEIPIVREHPDKVAIVPNGITLDPAVTPASIAARARGEGLRVLFVGRLETQKGLPPLLDAMDALPPDVTLDVVGRGPLEARVREATQRRPGIRYHGRVEEETLRRLFREAHVFVLASEFEAHSIALTEAMGAGLACLATDVGGNAEVLGGTGGELLSYPAPAKVLAARIRALAEDRATLARLGVAAHERCAREFAREAALRRTEAVYREALA